MSLSFLGSFVIAVSTVTLAAFYVYINNEKQKSNKRKDLYRLLKAEITALKSHCLFVRGETNYYTSASNLLIKTAVYNKGGLFLFDSKDAYLLDETLLEDMIRLNLISRNNDIHFQALIDNLEKIDDTKISLFKVSLSNRMAFTILFCEKFLLNLDKFIKNPRKYNEKSITSFIEEKMNALKDLPHFQYLEAIIESMKIMR